MSDKSRARSKRTVAERTAHFVRGSSGIGRLELLVMIVMAVCVLVAVPKWVLHNRETARKEQKMYHFRKMGQAISQYYDTYRTYPVLPKKLIRK